MSPAGATEAHVIDGLAQLRLTIAPERCHKALRGNSFVQLGLSPYNWGAPLRCAMGNTGP